MRSYLEALVLNLLLVNLPACSPDFNVDEIVWGWVRGEANGNVCPGSRQVVQDRAGKFLVVLNGRKDEVRQCCRMTLQSRAEALMRDSRPDSRRPANAHPTFDLF